MINGEEEELYSGLFKTLINDSLFSLGYEDVLKNGGYVAITMPVGNIDFWFVKFQDILHSSLCIIIMRSKKYCRQELGIELYYYFYIVEMNTTGYG